MISVCMCTYNGVKYVEEQLISIVKQSVVPDEIIVFDDASSDDTIELIKRISKEHTQINWVIKEQYQNKGWRVNFKDAINSATGDIIFLADQDDIWENEKIERMSQILINNSEILLLASGYNSLLMEGCSVNLSDTPSTEQILKIDKKKSFMYPYRPGCTFAFKKTLVSEFNQIWYKEAAHDQMLWNIAFLHNGLFVYEWQSIKFRRHSNNASSYYDERYSKDRYEKRLNDANTNCQLLRNYSYFYKDRIGLLKDGLRWGERRCKLLSKPTIMNVLMLIASSAYYPSKKVMLLDMYLSIKYSKYK